MFWRTSYGAVLVTYTPPCGEEGNITRGAEERILGACHYLYSRISLGGGEELIKRKRTRRNHQPLAMACLVVGAACWLASVAGVKVVKDLIENLASPLPGSPPL